jgi:acetyl-CoA synthetase
VVSENVNERAYLQIPERFNIAEAVIDRHVAAGRGGKVAAWVGERPYTYAEVRELSNRFGNVLRGIGVKRGDRVLLRLGTNLRAMVAILGTMKIGAVVIPSSFLFREHEVEKILLNSEAVVAISKPELAGPIEAVCARTPALRHLILVGGGGESSWERLMERASPDLFRSRRSRANLRSSSTPPARPATPRAFSRPIDGLSAQATRLIA